jgi:hypothetical protein
VYRTYPIRPEKVLMEAPGFERPRGRNDPRITSLA